MRRMPGRNVIAGIETLLTAGRTRSGDATRRTGAAAVRETDRETAYPRCVYQPMDDDWTVTMPINVHVVVPGERSAIAAIEAAFTGLENARWTTAVPDAATRAWNADAESLVAPDVSVRRPRLGERWCHVHAWAVDADRAAIHAHLDVVDLEYAYFHRGDHYDVAARTVSAKLSSGWQQGTSYDIEYGVDERTRADWGATGDTRLEYVVD